MDNTSGVIYILTNPSFPEYVKIGYADDVKRRLKELNRSECTPFAFRLYAFYEVNHRLTDMKLHNIIDRLNPDLRSIDNVDGKKRVREFYAMSKEDAYNFSENKLFVFALVCFFRFFVVQNLIFFKFCVLQNTQNGFLPCENAFDFVGHIFHQNFRFKVYLVVVFGALTVFFFLSVLAHHDKRSLNGRHAGQHQIKQDKRIRIKSFCGQ